MRALVTGGAGFIGSHLVDHLLLQGWEVRVLDDLSTGRLENLDCALESFGAPTLEVSIGSIVDDEAVEAVMADVDVVFHLAAAVGVLTIQQHTMESIRTNVHGTEVVLEAAHRHGAVALLTSTSEVYGKNTTPGLREDADRVLGSPLLSRWSYAECKALDEALAQQYHLRHGLRTVIVRLFNTTGPRQAGRYGMVVPRFVERAVHGDPLTIYGDGRQTRCFAHVLDIVPALARLATTPEAYGRALNLGQSQEISITGLAEMIIAMLQSDSRIEYVDYETAYGAGYEDMQRRMPDCSAAAELIGFSPTRGLDTVVRSIVEASGLPDPAVPLSTG